MYGTFVWKLSQIPPCLGLCRKNPNKGILVGLSSVLKVHLFWFWFGRKIFGEKGEKYPFPVFSPTPLHLGEGVLV